MAADQSSNASLLLLEDLQSFSGQTGSVPSSEFSVHHEASWLEVALDKQEASKHTWRPPNPLTRLGS